MRLGHEVHLLCQDRHPEEHGFVDAVGDWDCGCSAGARRCIARRASGAGRGRCIVYRPDIGGLLPVYVADRYEGIEARTFAECSEAEVQRYLERTWRPCAELPGSCAPQVALANHLVMGPVILARALGGEVPYAVKIHGSALEYTVKPQPERFLGLGPRGAGGGARGSWSAPITRPPACGRRSATPSSQSAPAWAPRASMSSASRRARPAAAAAGRRGRCRAHLRSIEDASQASEASAFSRDAPDRGSRTREPGARA